MGTQAKGKVSIQCVSCKKMIDMDEYVINWTHCAECFDRSFDEYLKSKPSTGGDTIG